MKNIKNRWLGIAIAPFALAFLAMAQPALANDYSGNCADFPNLPGGGTFDGNGTVTITDTGSCTLGQSVTASGDISITAPGSITTQALTSSGGNVTVDGGGSVITGAVSSGLNTNLKGTSVTSGAITSDWGVQVEATSGTLTLNTVTSNNNNSSFGGNILLTATGNIGVGNVKNNGTTTTAGIEIRANTGGAATTFNIGGGGANGSGILNVSSTTGGGTNPYYMPNGIYVTNGASGNITVSSMASLLVTSSGSRSGILILDARNGTLTLPTGVLSSDGSGANGAGLITLLAGTITTVNGTVISASQTTSGYQHGINIAATTINLAGATGLEVRANGNGITGSYGSTYVAIVPKDGVAVAFSGPLNNRSWQITYVNYFQKTGSITVNGATSLLKVTANGDYSRLGISAYPITFNNKTVTIQSRASVDHNVQIGFSGSYTNMLGLAFLGNGVVSIDANATTGTGGNVSLFSDKFTFNSPTFNINANGPSTGTSNGDGGTVYLSSSALTKASASKVTVTANASSVGSGNAQLSTSAFGASAILFYPGNVQMNIGTAAGQYSFSAKGGSTGGNGGTIVISSNSVHIKTANAVNASAIAAAGNGEGGEITFYSFVQTVDPAATMSAIGKGTGKGGKFTAYSAAFPSKLNTYIKVDSGTTAVVATSAGTIALNGVTCGQWKAGIGTGNVSWPKTYWDCANPTAPDTTVATAVSALPASFKTNLGNQNIALYIFNLPANFNSFWSQAIPNVASVNNSALKYAVVFNNTPSTDYTAFLRGNMMHELGHLLDGGTSGTPAFTGPANQAITKLTGVYTLPAGPQTPDCMAVYNDNGFCTDPLIIGGTVGNPPNPPKTPWQIFYEQFITDLQPTNGELFAYSFQNCSGFGVKNGALDTAEQSIYMIDLYNYQNTTFWPGGCP